MGSTTFLGCADTAHADCVVTAAGRTDLIEFSVSRNARSCKRRAARQEDNGTRATPARSTIRHRRAAVRCRCRDTRSHATTVGTHARATASRTRGAGVPGSRCARRSQDLVAAIRARSMASIRSSPPSGPGAERRKVAAAPVRVSAGGMTDAIVGRRPPEAAAEGPRSSAIGAGSFPPSRGRDSEASGSVTAAWRSRASCSTRAGVCSRRRGWSPGDRTVVSTATAACRGEATLCLNAGSRESDCPLPPTAGTPSGSTISDSR